MVHRWRCRHCAFAIWTADPGAAIEAIGSHLHAHHRNRLSKEDLWVSWNCPYCDQSVVDQDETKGVQQFREHLFEHAQPRVESEVHAADEINRTGNVMIQTGTGSGGADNARIHFLAPADIVVFVTTVPGDRVRLLKNSFSEWPASTLVLTTKGDSFGGVDIPDPAALPIEVVRIDRPLSPSDLGETISRVLGEQNSAQAKVSVEFDILTELISEFDTQTLFKFLHLLVSRVERADAIGHYYVDPQESSLPTINVLKELFDMVIRATDKRLISEPDG